MSTIRLNQFGACLILCCIGAANLQADTAIFTGYFDGTQPKAARLEGPGCLPTQFPYFDSGTFRVSRSERFEIFSAQGLHEVVVGVYTGAFNPTSVATNRVALLEGIRAHGLSIGLWYGQVELQSGTDYRLVVQPTCQQNEQSGIYKGPFGVGIVPADLDSTARASGSSLRPLPAYMQGVFDGDEPRVNDDYYSDWYEVNGPVRLPHTGLYFRKGIPGENNVPLRIDVYDAPFDPNHPLENRVSTGYADNVGWGNRFYLRANQDYYFVARPLERNETGRWMFALAQQRGFFMNPGMNGSWWDPQLNGQGFFIDVLEEIGAVFVGWFTYDVDGPSDPHDATVGYTGSRWLTAYGPYDGGSAELNIELTTGGLFDDAAGVVQNTPYGTLQLDFQDCDSGTVFYDIPAAGVAGQMNIVRINYGNEALCGDYFINNDGVLLTD